MRPIIRSKRGKSWFVAFTVKASQHKLWRDYDLWNILSLSCNQNVHSNTYRVTIFALTILCQCRVFLRDLPFVAYRDEKFASFFWMNLFELRAHVFLIWFKTAGHRSFSFKKFAVVLAKLYAFTCARSVVYAHYHSIQPEMSKRSFFGTQYALEFDCP